MKRLMRCALCGILIASLQVTSFAEGETQESKTTISGFGYFMFGQIVSGILGSTYPKPGIPSTFILQHYWQENADVDLYLTSKPNDWFTTKAGLSVIKTFPIQAGAMDRASFYTNFNFSIPMAEGIFHWNFDKEALWPDQSQRPPTAITSLMIEAGFFQYTFNPEVKNLGNYMFRSTILPLSIQTRIDYPWADLMGMRTQIGLLDEKVKLEAILASEIMQLPWYDWDLAFTGSYAPNKIIDIGAGICFNRLINVGHAPFIADSSQEKMRGTKIETRFAFDPKPLIKELFGEEALSMFGPEDGKIYGEAAVLGQEDRSLYAYIPPPEYVLGLPIRRMPLLLGMNVPGFKLLDVISVELEYFKSPYPNDWIGELQYANPFPTDFSDPHRIKNYVNDDNWKWSIYLKKKIANFEIRGMAANDHAIYKSFDIENTPCFEQTLRRPGDWHWYFEFRYNL
ncbi:MAG: hypothetical protein JW699_08545 [Chitinispirillaceae bacterium]|nr:hypothetical protein [Chitinispirillaceae bacterium]